MLEGEVLKAKGSMDFFLLFLVQFNILGLFLHLKVKLEWD